MTSGNSHSNPRGVASADAWVRVASSRRGTSRKYLAGASGKTRKNGNAPSTDRIALATADSGGPRGQIAPAGRRTPGWRNQESSSVAAQFLPSASVALAAPVGPPRRCNRSPNIWRRKQSRSRPGPVHTRRLVPGKRTRRPRFDVLPQRRPYRSAPSCSVSVVWPQSPGRILGLDFCVSRMRKNSFSRVSR